jgi:hypothetical protein
MPLAAILIAIQVPLPTGDVWVQFPLVAVIVACFALAGIGIFAFTKWIWGEYKRERDKDLAWRELQNKAREDAVAEQNRLWREAMAARDLRYEQYDKERQGTLAQLAASMAGLVTKLDDHDVQAKEILIITERIDQHTQPIPGRRTQIKKGDF